MNALDYPKVDLPDGKTYRLRFSFKSARLMASWGIGEEAPTTPDQAWRQLCGQVAGSAYIEEAEGKMAFCDLTPDYVRDLYDDDPEIYQMKALRDAVRATVNFRMPSDENGQSGAAAAKN